MEPRRPLAGSGADHGDWLDALASVALGTATREERDAVAAHLPGCPICRASAPTLRSAVSALPLALPDQEPPPGMRARFEARLAAELSAAAPWGHDWGRPGADARMPVRSPHVPGQPPEAPDHPLDDRRQPRPSAFPVSEVEPRRLGARRIGAAVAAAVLIAALLGGLLAWNLRLRSALDDRPGAEAIALVTQQGAPGVTATSSYLPNRDVLTVSLHDAPALDPDQVYQLWLVQGEAVIPFGIFDRASGECAVVADPAGYDAVVVTTEPAPFGSASATTAPLLVAAITPG